jgi:transposase, IS5 family
MTEQKQIQGKSVANDKKLFSIYELHTDIIVKGDREVLFGHKVNLTDGKGKLILDCEILKGNPSDSTLFATAITRVKEAYGKTPKSVATDGGYASKANLEKATEMGLTNMSEYFKTAPNLDFALIFIRSTSARFVLLAL